MAREEAVAAAHGLVEQGRFGEAKRLLLALAQEPGGLGDDAVAFVALRTLARCHRQDREFDEARAAGTQALALARSGKTPVAGEAVMLEGLALIESEAGNLRAAGAYFFESANVERARGDLPAMAAALSNYANMLVSSGLEGAESLLKDALSVAPPASIYYASAADNMGLELERQGRHAEAVEWARRAADAYRGRDDSYNLFVSLRNLARHLRDAGMTDEGAAAFEEAHDLIIRARQAQVDDEHYAQYPKRVAAIEEHTRELVAKEGEGAWITIGANALLGQRSLDEGMEALEAGRFAKAVELLTESRECWVRLEAWHSIVVVDHHLSYALIEIGQTSAALDLAARTRDLARSLGDAFREQMALSLLILLHRQTTGDELDYLAQALALTSAARRQRGIDPAAQTQMLDGGVLSSSAARICADASAYAMAERYSEETIALARAMPKPLRHRLAYRLHNFYFLLRNTGKPERAEEVLAELREVVAELGDDPRALRVLARATVRQAFHDGDRSEATLAGLMDECAAYERMREQARGPSPLAGFSEATDPPFEEAAEVALALDRLPLALALLERGKARTLLESRGLSLPVLTGPGDADPELPDLGEAVGLELFVGSSRIGLLAVDGRSGELTWSDLPGEGEGEARLGRLLRALSDAADSERGVARHDAALEAVLADPLFHDLGRLLLSAVPAGRAAWLAPHRFLHQAPLQLCASTAESTTTAVPWSILPALPLAETLPRPRLARTGWTVVACGDPLGDLPFARAEARLVADGGGPLALGSGCTVGWLEEQLRGDDVGVLHLACHGRFDRGHPERSGLLLAAAPDEQYAGTSAAHLMAVEDVAALPLEGVVVILSACSSGLEVVRDGDEATGLVSALLRAGASSIIAAQWPISDLAAMLLMVDFYDRVRVERPPPDLLAPLAAATAALRSMSATELCRRGFALAEALAGRGGTDGERFGLAAVSLGVALTAIGDSASAGVVAEMAATGPAADGEPLAPLRALAPPDDARSAVMPFAGPEHWGAFAVVGGGATSAFVSTDMREGTDAGFRRTP